MKTRNKTVVPRNPYAVAATLKKAGKHEKSNKAKRQENKQTLSKILKNESDDQGGETSAI